MLGIEFLEHGLHGGKGVRCYRHGALADEVPVLWSDGCGGLDDCSNELHVCLGGLDGSFHQLTGAGWGEGDFLFNDLKGGGRIGSNGLLDRKDVFHTIHLGESRRRGQQS